MKMSIIVLSIVLAMFVMTGCAGYHGTLEMTPTGVKGDSNKPLEITKTIDKDGNTTMTFSSKKGASILDNIITILSLGLIKR